MMAAPTPLVLTFDAEMLALLGSAAAWRNMTAGNYARSAIEAATRMDAGLATFVQEGIDSADRGELISQEDMEEWFEARYRSAAAE